MNPNIKRDYSALAELLHPLGFVETHPGCFQHSLIDQEFDFTAVSPEGAIFKVFSIGAENGAEAIKQNLCDKMKKLGL